MIPLKRMQQAVHEATAGMNRAASTGTGSGFNIVQLLADTATGSINQTYTGIGKANAVDVTNSSTDFPIARTSHILVLAQMMFGFQSNTSDYSYIYLDIDGSQSGQEAAAGTAVPNAYTATLTAVSLLMPGFHTVKVRAYVGGATATGIVYRGEIFIFQFGA